MKNEQVKQIESIREKTAGEIHEPEETMAKLATTAKNRALRLWLLYLSLASALALILGAGLITGWGEWYSGSFPHRQQTEAFMSGRVSLGDSPADVPHDHVWAEGGVQQVWGLGVPVWRLPFELGAKAFGKEMFSDRIALVVALTVFAFLVLRAFMVPVGVRSVSNCVQQLQEYPERVIAAGLLIFFPPVITVLRGSFYVYEEVIVYGFLYSVSLFTGLAVFRRRPTEGVYLLLCLAGGLAGFVRPTALSYGLATVVCGFVIARHAGWPWRSAFGGVVAFAFGLCLLLATNWERFGSWSEFGHGLNITGMDLMYMSRFEAPFESASAWAAARELFGSTFLGPELNGFEVYEEGVVPLQAAETRWRHFYHTTFDLTFLAVALFGWAFGAWVLTYRIVRERVLRLDEVSLAAVWSLGGLLPIAYFFLDFHAMSSRYVMDFAPGIAVSMVAGIYGIAKFAMERKGSWTIVKVMVIGSVVWWGWQLLAAKHSSPIRVFTQEQVQAMMPRDQTSSTKITVNYDLGANRPRDSGIHNNGRGWNENGRTGPLVILFVEDPERLVVELEPVPDEEPLEKDYALIRVKVGLEELRLTLIEDTGVGCRLHFAGPGQKRYRKGVHVVFLALVPPSGIRAGESPFQLLQVEWRAPRASNE